MIGAYFNTVVSHVISNETKREIENRTSGYPSLPNNRKNHSLLVRQGSSELSFRKRGSSGEAANCRRGETSHKKVSSSQIMRPFERLVRFDLRTSFSARQNSTSLVHDYRENYRDRERETFLKWRTNYNFLQTFRYIYTFLIEDIIFLSLVKNKLIAKKVFVGGKSLSRYLRMPKFGQR